MAEQPDHESNLLLAHIDQQKTRARLRTRLRTTRSIKLFKDTAKRMWGEEACFPRPRTFFCNFESRRKAISPIDQGVTDRWERNWTTAVETRDLIIQYIDSHPGAHLRQIKRDLRISMGVTQYHLYTLEREKKILSKRTDFTSGSFRRLALEIVSGKFSTCFPRKSKGIYFFT